MVFIGFFSELYTGSNVPFMFAPVALYELFSLLFHRLRFLTFGLFLWCCFFSAEIFSSKLGPFDAAVQVQSLYPLLILKRLNRAVKHVFLLANLHLELVLSLAAARLVSVF